MPRALRQDFGDTIESTGGARLNGVVEAQYTAGSGESHADWRPGSEILGGGNQIVVADLASNLQRDLMICARTDSQSRQSSRHSIGGLVQPKESHALC